MNKAMYLIRGLKEESYDDFKKRIHDLANDIYKKYDPATLKIVLTETPPPLFSIIPFRKTKIAVFSIKNDASTFIPEIKNTNGFTGAFEVTEALPVAYTKNWQDGTATPGICLLTLFNQKKNIDHKTFIDRWHNGHTPLSLKLHPLWNYNRNVVDQRNPENIENWDGIVEEHFRTKSDLLNPFKFFGHPFRIIPNMLLVYLDTKSFLDYKTIEPYLAMEYHLKS